MVGHGDCAQADLLGVVEKVGHRHGAVMRVLGVHVQVGEDERPVGERIGACRRRGTPLAEDGAVEPLEVVGEAAEARLLGTSPRVGGGLCAPLSVLGEPRQSGADELRLDVRSGRIDQRHAGGLRFEREPGVRTERRDEARCARQLGRA